MFKNQYRPMANIHPDRKHTTTVMYQVEYTDKDEEINSDFSNLHQFTAADLSKAMELAYDLRSRGKFNIGIYYLVEDPTGWIIEDSCNYIEQITSREDQSKIVTMTQTIQRQESELATMREFLRAYNAEQLYKQFKEKAGD
jgi:hypothetical protein